VAVVIVLALGGGSAIAAGLIGSGDIKNNSIKSKDVKNKTLKTKDFSDAARAELQGEDGADGADGVAVYSNPEWGIIARNQIGSAVADLRGGPFVPEADPNPPVTGSPPFGQGSLAIAVSDQAQNPNAPGASGLPQEKASFGNEVDFAGDLVSDLTDVGFHVFQTAENSARGTGNMPSISFEIDPNGAGGSTTGFTTLVYTPDNSASNQWSGYINAVSDPNPHWGLTGSQFNANPNTTCGINGTRCTFAQIQTFLATGTGAVIGTAAVTKGRDNSWVGAVDGLRINDVVYDFEPFGVEEEDATP
jgi:hypothetical protein